MPLKHLPVQLRERLLVELYRQASDLDWEFLSNSEKTNQYRRWIEDPKIGGVLLAFGEEKDARVWIKDVPMKEYARAQEGIGHYARYAVKCFRGAEEIVHAAFGDGWRVQSDTVEEKPNHCYGTDGLSIRYVCWGPAGTYRDLIWASLNEAIGAEEPPAIVVTTRDGEMVSTEDRRKQIRVAAHCGVELKYIHRHMILNPGYVGDLGDRSASDARQP